MCYQYLTGRQVVQFNKYPKTYGHFQYKQKVANLTYIFTIWIVTGAKQILSKLAAVVTELARLLCGGGGHLLHIYSKGHIAPGVERLPANLPSSFLV